MLVLMLLGDKVTARKGERERSDGKPTHLGASSIERTSRWTFERAAGGRVSGGSDAEDDQGGRRFGTIAGVVGEEGFDLGC